MAIGSVRFDLLCPESTVSHVALLGRTQRPARKIGILMFNLRFGNIAVDLLGDPIPQPTKSDPSRRWPR